MQCNVVHSLSIGNTLVDGSMKHSLQNGFYWQVLLIITEGPVEVYFYLVSVLLGQRLLQHLLVLLGKLRQFCQFYTAQHHPYTQTASLCSTVQSVWYALEKAEVHLVVTIPAKRARLQHLLPLTCSKHTL